MRVTDSAKEGVTKAKVVVDSAVAMSFEGDLKSFSGKCPFGLTPVKCEA